MTAVIEVTGLTKRYGGRRGQAVVDDISFHVGKGEIFGILGPNGAGKTTAVECMEGLRRRDGGQVRILGLDPLTDRHRLHQRIGVQLQESQLQEKLKVREASSCMPRSTRTRPIGASCSSAGGWPERRTLGSPGSPAGGSPAHYMLRCGCAPARSLTSLQEDGMPDSGHVMLTVLLHHDQSKTLDEIMAHLKKTGFYRDFPPEGSELVSWVVAMSFGFVINLKVEADKVRSVNRYMEQKAWGAFRYQVFPSYDFAPIAADLKKQHA